MKYQKSTFVVVPNKHILRGKNAITQTVFLWICHFANDDGHCFPSMTTLAKCSGISRRSVVNHVEKLEEYGLITKEVRKDGKKNLTNVYSVNTLEDVGGAGDALGGAGDALGVVQEMHRELKPIRTQSTELKESTPAQKAVSFFEGITSLKNKAPSNGTAEFLQELSGRVGLGKDVLWREVQAFTSYWTELDKLGKRQRWQLERTFEVEKRLSTWLRRCNERGKPQNFTQKPKYKAGIV